MCIYQGGLVSITAALSIKGASYLSGEGNHVVFAQRKHLDILDNHQLVVIFMENCAVDEVPDILLVTLSEVEHGLGISLGRLAQTFSFRVLSDTLQDRPDSACELLDALLRLLGRRLQSRPGAGA